MLPNGQSLARAFARFATRKPERLWVPYVVAAGLLFGLIAITHALDKKTVERTVTASQSIKVANAHVMLAEAVLDLAAIQGLASDADRIQLQTATAEFEAALSDYLDNLDIHGPVFAYYTDGQPSLVAQLADFIALARLSSSPDQPAAMQARLQLHQLFHDQGMQDRMVAVSGILAEVISGEADRLTALRDTLLTATALLLLAEALLVFWPAQYAVQTTIQKLQRQKGVLLASQTRLKQVNERLQHLLRRDQLTGLPNRNSLIAFLERMIARRETADLRLYLFGLDGFKTVNDMIGHDYGDELLVKVGAALSDCVDSEDMIARVGGDEFVVVSAEDSAALLSRVDAAIKAPFDIKGRRIPAKASVGYLDIGTAVRKPMDILGDAEIALQAAKGNGGGQSLAFTSSLRADLGQMQELQLELQEAIQNGEIEPWFQPQIRLSDGLLHGAEVLARWRHPKRGLLPPVAFLDASERAGLIVDLDHTIWCAAMMQARDWQDQGIWRPSISLNAAPDTIADPHLIERFLFTLNRSGLQPDQVVIEVLETTLIEGNDDMAAINIDHLAECGIALELDDFGTGYASLSKLTQLPLAGIKLDRSLVAPLPDQAADSVVRAILALAAELGLSVVAEGIEERVQARHLGKSGCRIGQGYGFGKPMPADEFTDWLKSHAEIPAQLLFDPPVKARRA